MQNNKIRQTGRDGINKIKLQGGTKCNWKQARGVLASNVTGLRSPGHKVQMSFLSPQETTKQGRGYDHTPQTLIRFHNQHPKTLELKKCLENCKNKIKNFLKMRKVSYRTLSFCSAQEVLTSTSKAGAAKMFTSTGSTSTATFWWFERRREACSTCGTRSTAPTSSRPTSTACACSPRPWTRPRTASWGCSSSGTRLKLTSASRNCSKTRTLRRLECWSQRLNYGGSLCNRSWWTQLIWTLCFKRIAVKCSCLLSCWELLRWSTRENPSLSCWVTFFLFIFWLGLSSSLLPAFPVFALG